MHLLYGQALCAVEPTLDTLGGIWTCSLVHALCGLGCGGQGALLQQWVVADMCATLSLWRLVMSQLLRTGCVALQEALCDKICEAAALAVPSHMLTSQDSTGIPCNLLLQEACVACFADSSCVSDACQTHIIVLLPPTMPACSSRLPAGSASQCCSVC